LDTGAAEAGTAIWSVGPTKVIVLVGCRQREGDSH
jgi:hypothetical protein